MIQDTLYEKGALLHLCPILGDMAETTLCQQLEERDFVDPVCKDLFKFFKLCVEKKTKVDASDIQDKFQKKYPKHPPYIWLEWILEWQFIGAPHQIVERLKLLTARREAKAFKVQGHDPDHYVQQLSDKSKEISDLVARHRLSKDDMVARIKKGVKTSPTGFKTLDRLSSGGIEDGGMMIICAQPGTGKTAMAVNIAVNNLSAGKSVYFGSLEMPEERLLTRFFQCFWDKTEKEVQKNVDDMNNLPADLEIVNPGSDISKIMASMTVNLDCDLFILDYFTLIQKQGDGSRIQKMEDICHELKNFALNNRKPVILLAQPNRQWQNDKTNREPQLSDLAWCSALEQDSHIVSFLWDKNAKDMDDELTKVAQFFNGDEHKQKDQDLKWVIKKNRNGQQGIIDLDFNGSTMKFSERSPSK